MSTESNNVDAFQGNTTTPTASNNVNAFPITIISSTPPTPSAPVWETVEDYDWSAQATSTVLTGAGTATMGGKSITNVTVSSTPTYTTQNVNGSGLVFTIVSGLAGSGGSAFRFDLVPGNYNPGEQVLVEMLFTGVSFTVTGVQQLWGIGAGGHYSQVEWHGVQLISQTGNITADHNARGFSTSGGARSVTMAADQPISTDYLVQVWYDGTFCSRVAVLEGQTTFLSQPVVGAASPFNASLDDGHTGCQTAAPQADLLGVFATTLRCVCGIGTNEGGFTLRRHRISRPTRM
jgi:hypothetical protein